MRPTDSLAALAIAAAIACGPRQVAPPPAAGPDAGAPGRTDDDEITGESALTPDDCVRMIDHVLAIGMADQRARKAPELVPTAEQVATIRADMLEEQLAPCLAMPRPQWACALAARTMPALYSCGGGSAPATP